ncbi:helix-turn-helix domain-containing protein [Rahnella sp. PD12R]|uniref:helix-turn-helix domain-containing protein n=1 Tax=Rahnella sp. PD12R TaxID=2855688 RepID=UPI001C493935|nr:helix-turn-helix domain-containing protein [Rahnella sp. PD12R]MBV6819038.1 helix-turn-helix domain-containing protein [Rahnella sp. PD12R]
MRVLGELPALLKKQRQQLELSQQDMRMRTGMSQQQYQKIEAGADPRLSTLLRILEGMDLEMMLVPRKRVQQIKELLDSKNSTYNRQSEQEPESLNNDWDDILGDLKE